MVIHAARRPSREGRVPGCEIGAVLRSRLAFWAPLIPDQGRSATVNIAMHPMYARVSPDDLATAVDALIENVIAHTPEGTNVEVSTREDDNDGARMNVLTIADHGPGLPLGVGVRGRSDRGSTGLGLDIAGRCARAGGDFCAWTPPLPAVLSSSSGWRSRRGVLRLSTARLDPELIRRCGMPEGRRRILEPWTPRRTRLLANARP